MLEQFAADPEDDASARQQVAKAFAKLEKDTVRERIAVRKMRPDGREQTEIRAASRSRPACCRAPTARRSSRAARRRPSASPRSAR